MLLVACSLSFQQQSSNNIIRAFKLFYVGYFPAKASLTSKSPERLLGSAILDVISAAPADSDLSLYNSGLQTVITGPDAALC